MNLVDFDEVIAECVAILGYGEDEEVAKTFAKQWVWGAKKKLSVSDNTLHVCSITAKNLLLKKPNNFKRLDSIALFDSTGSFIPHVFHQGVERIYPNTEAYTYTITTDEHTQITYNLPVDLSESQTSFVLGTNGTMVSEALIRYWPLPLDANGIPEIYDHEVDACKAYVRYQWSMRKNENQSEIAVNRQTWKEECDWAKAQTKSMDFSAELRKRIGSITNRMVPNFNRSQF